MTRPLPLRNAVAIAPLSLAASPVTATVPTSGQPATTTPVCEPFVDRREARTQAGLLVAVSRVDPASVVEDRREQPPVSQMLVTGTADIILDRFHKGAAAPPASTGGRLKASYAYWLPVGGRSGWQPARAVGDYVFRFAPQPGQDSRFRVALHAPSKPMLTPLLP